MQTDPLLAVFQVVVLIMSVVVHELAHGYAANSLGDPTARLAGRLTINPIKHLDPFGSVILPLLLVISNSPFILGWAKPVPYNPYNLKSKSAETFVAGAGILANLGLAIIFGLIIRFGAGALPDSFIVMAQIVVFINILLAVFNLVPIPPLDGSKVLFNMLPFDFRRFEVMLERWGFVILLFFIFFLWQYLFPIIAFIYKLIVGIDI